MLSLEILVAFTIVFALTAAGLRYWQLYRMPLGFVAQDVWSVELRTNGVAAGPHYVAAFQNAVRTLPAVQDVAIASFGPYSGSSMLDQAKSPGGIRATNDMIEAGANFAGVLGLDVVAGHWPGAGDDAHAVAIDRAMAAALFPGTNALGRTFTQNDEVQPVRVVGIVDAYRSTGELATPMPVVFRRFTDGGMINRLMQGAGTLVVKVAPGTGRAFERALRQRLLTVRNDWSYHIVPLATMRASVLAGALRPLAMLAVIGAFMLLMVAFGLFGALWQNTTQRIPEIGLRRALGARRVDIYGQIIAEQLLVSSLAMGVALLLLVQLPLTGALGAALNWPVFIGAAGLSMAVIYLLSCACALYPGWRASRHSPTQALHDE